MLRKPIAVRISKRAKTFTFLRISWIFTKHASMNWFIRKNYSSNVLREGEGFVKWIDKASIGSTSRWIAEYSVGSPGGTSLVCEAIRLERACALGPPRFAINFSDCPALKNATVAQRRGVREAINFTNTVVRASWDCRRQSPFIGRQKVYRLSVDPRRVVSDACQKSPRLPGPTKNTFRTYRRGQIDAIVRAISRFFAVK